MSIDLNWETLTTGPDGQELAHRIRDFIHSKFQTVPLPRFIKSVTVHDFEFGSIGPELELKDITDPLPDFYEEDAEDDEDGSDEEGASDDSDEYGPQFSDDEQQQTPGRRQRRRQPDNRSPRRTVEGGRRGMRHHHGHQAHHQHRHDLSGSSHHTITGLGVGGTTTPATAGAPGTRGGVPGGTSNLLHHFHSHLTPAGWSGTQTPLAAMAGGNLGGGSGQPGGPNGGGYFYQDHHYAYNNMNNMNIRQDNTTPPPNHSRNPSHSSSISVGDYYRDNLRLTPGGGIASSPPSNLPSLLQHPALREKHSVSTLAPTSAGGASRPPTRDGKQQQGPPHMSQMLGGSAIEDHDDSSEGGDNDMDRTLLLGQATGGPGGAPGPSPSPRFRREPRAEDMQAVFRIRYAGDVKLLLTADILLDYPMPSFVGIPVRLSITGLTFDGVGVLANIRKRVHFCFLSPEDALAAVGDDEAGEGDEDDDNVGDRRDEDYERPAPATPGRRPTTASAAAAQASPAPSHTLPRTKMGGLLQEVRVESEIGQRESGKQSLKNVGKVERFVLEQVRRIFEEEFVYPSFWTFLV
ncbi:Mitochondrial distribution and morphology protein 12 [Sporothrix stenoceras]|uniref:Mitochondrial distribution and morphology protein 12 n=1 Tax=Sporothrix stenoceras TaxID=5173 RepID=A0ABR3ZHK6_9PEZI